MEESATKPQGDLEVEKHTESSTRENATRSMGLLPGGRGESNDREIENTWTIMECLKKNRKGQFPNCEQWKETSQLIKG